jgi:hypothetical protein
MTYNAHVLLIPLDSGAFSLGHPAGNRDLFDGPNRRPLLTRMSVTIKRMGNHGSFSNFHDPTHFLIQNRLTSCI